MPTQQGYFFIADITGYTTYLNKSELEHAQQTLTALLNLIIAHTKPPLIISRLAGDAVISYALRDHFLQGQTFVELIEDTYVAFRRAIDLMILNTTCRCNACANIHALDLKFFVHYGAFGIQKLDRHDEIVGADVIVIHRLLKNTVTARTGIRAYALYTDAAIRQLGLEDLCDWMTAHHETYEELGTVPVWVQDLHPVWDRKKDSLDVVLPPKTIVFEVEAEVRLPIELVWDYLTRPEYRSILIGSDRQEIDQRQEGRVGEGSVYMCYHGTDTIRQTIILWKPFDHMITQDLLPIPFPNTSVYLDYRLNSTERGTRLVQAASKAVTGPALGRLLVNLVMPTKRKEFERDILKFKEFLEQEDARRGTISGIPKPPAEAVGERTSRNPDNR